MRLRSVLIVDDDTIERDSMRGWLECFGYQVKTVGTGEEALELIKLNNFHVIVLDAFLPGRIGIRVLREAKIIRPNMRTVVMTAYPSVEMAVEAMKLGAVDYLIKPIMPEQLERLINQTVCKCIEEIPVKEYERFLPLLNDLLKAATDHSGYITSETLVSTDKTTISVITSWDSIGAWKSWETSEKRNTLLQLMSSMMTQEHRVRTYEIMEGD